MTTVQVGRRNWGEIKAREGQSDGCDLDAPAASMSAVLALIPDEAEGRPPLEHVYWCHHSDRDRDRGISNVTLQGCQRLR